MRHASILALVLILAGCGDDTSPVDAGTDAASEPTDAGSTSEADAFVALDAASAVDASAPVDAAASEFALTSTAYAEGGAIPQAQSCNGDNVSPPLAWTGAPSGTASFALTLVDESNGLTHSAFFDIPADTTSLPGALENVPEPSEPAGMKQVRGYDGATYGYLGPCPGSAHTYTFTLYALDVDALSGVTTSSSRAQVTAALEGHVLDTATLTGVYTP